MQTKPESCHTLFHALAPMPSIRAYPLCIEKVLASHDMCVCWFSVTEPCPILSDPMDLSRTGSSVHGIVQARILERVAISFSWAPPHAEVKPSSPTRAGRLFTTVSPGKPLVLLSFIQCS